MDGDIAELKGDVKVLKEDVRVLKEDVRVLKEDVKVLKEDVRVLKQDVVELKRDVAKLKDDVALLQRQMERMMALMEEFNTKLTLALEMLQHCVHMIPAVSKHDLQITKAKDDVHVTQTILSDHIQNQEIHVTPKRGRPRKTSKGTPEENL
jgi:chromosome segregation ATPase